MLFGCVLALALHAGTDAPAATAFHDDFNGALDPAWSIVRPDAGYYIAQSTGLVLRCNNGDLWGNYNNARNVFLITNPLPGDCLVTIKLRWLVPPSANWAQFDLLAYDDDNNHVRVDYTYSSGALGVGRIAETGGVVAQEGGARVDFGPDWFWLQLRKQGATYSPSYSTNGIAFQPATAPFSYGDGTPAMLGFVAMVDLGGQTATVLVDSFTVENAPGWAPSGLISWWRGEGNAADEAGAHPGTPLGGLAYAPGQVGQGFVFNGQDAAVALGNWFDRQEFTISLWIKPAAGQVLHADILDNNHTDFRGWVLQSANTPTTTASQWVWGCTGVGGFYYWMTNTAWQHFAVTVSTNRTARLYLDGRLADTTSGPGPIIYDGAQYLNLGKHQVYGRSFNGMVDELMMLDHPLAESEVAALYVSQGGRPMLGIERISPDELRLSWPVAADGWVLEWTNALPVVSVPWSLIPPPYKTNGANLQFSEPLPAGNKFYRLHKP